MIPARFKVIVTRRPKYTCRECDGEVAQAPLEHLIEGGIPTEALIARWSSPNTRTICRSIGRLRSMAARASNSTARRWPTGRDAPPSRYGPSTSDCSTSKGSDKLFADETRMPVLDPADGKTKTGQARAYARDDRPWGGPEPPGVAYVYEPDRKHERPAAHLAGFAGCLQVDGYGATKIAEGNAVTLASAGRTRGETSSTSRP